MDRILFLGKGTTKNDKYYLQIYFLGATVNVFVTKEQFDNCKMLTGQKMDFNNFNLECYNKGYDTVVRLKLK